MSQISMSTIEELKDLLIRGGKIALEQQRSTRVQFKSDRTPFTDVELEIESLIIPFLQRQFPKSQIITEENGIYGEASSSVWALDPVDGTKVFVNGLPNWGVSLGLLEDGEPRFGFFYMPVSGDLYWGGKDFGAHLNDIDLTTVTRLAYDDPLAFLAVTSNAHRHYNFDYPRVHAFGSTAANLCYVARGIAVGALTRKINIWDVAGVLPILDQTGIQVEFLTLGDFSAKPYLNEEKLPEGILAAHPDNMDRVRAGIHRK